MPVDTVRSEYAAALPWWKRCRDVIEGEDAVKARGTEYLPKLPEQESSEYEAYKMRAVFYNGTARTQSALVGTVFRKDPTVNLPERLKTKLQPHLEDVTLDSTPLDQFSSLLFADILAAGRHGVLIDMQGEDVLEKDRRPYWVGYTAEQIINWQESRLNGSTVLSLVILKECVETMKEDYSYTSVDQWRVLELKDIEAGLPKYTVTLYRKNERNEIRVFQDPITPVRRGQPIPFIPFVVFNATSLRARVEKPPMLDLVDMNLSHYRTSADHEHGLHWTALPTPWVVGSPAEGALRIGSGVVWQLDGPDAKAGMLEFTGKGIQSVRDNLTMKEERMAVLGARMIEGGTKQAETAEAVRSRHAGTHAVLKTIATTTSTGLTKALRYHSWWMGATDDPNDAAISIALNKEFYDQRMSADDVKTALLAVQAGQMSFETFWFLMSRGDWTRPDVTAEEEKQQIDSELPEEPPALPALGASDGNGNDGNNPAEEDLSA